MQRKLLKIGLIVNILLLVLISSVFAAGETPEVTRVYRLYNKVSGEHLFTPQKTEVDTLIAQPDWTYEGVAWSSPLSGDPVYRVFNTREGGHLYTKDAVEVNRISREGWQVDNNAQPFFYSGGQIPVYRLFNPYDGDRLLTTFEVEYNQLGDLGWNKEGVAFYALYLQEPDIKVTNVEIDKKELTLNIGETATLTATVSPNDATNKNVSWKSSNPEVASVTNGTVKALKAGEAEIIVATEDGNYSATCTVAVNEDSESNELI